MVNNPFSAVNRPFAKLFLFRKIQSSYFLSFFNFKTLEASHFASLLIITCMAVFFELKLNISCTGKMTSFVKILIVAVIINRYFHVTLSAKVQYSHIAYGELNCCSLDKHQLHKEIWKKYCSCTVLIKKYS